MNIKNALENNKTAIPYLIGLFLITCSYRLSPVSPLLFWLAYAGAVLWCCDYWKHKIFYRWKTVTIGICLFFISLIFGWQKLTFPFLFCLIPACFLFGLGIPEDKKIKFRNQSQKILHIIFFIIADVGVAIFILSLFSDILLLSALGAGLCTFFASFLSDEL